MTQPNLNIIQQNYFSLPDMLIEQNIHQPNISLNQKTEIKLNLVDPKSHELAYLPGPATVGLILSPMSSTVQRVENTWFLERNGHKVHMQGESEAQPELTTQNPEREIHNQEKAMLDCYQDPRTSN